MRTINDNDNDDDGTTKENVDTPKHWFVHWSRTLFFLVYIGFGRTPILIGVDIIILLSYSYYTRSIYI